MKKLRLCVTWILLLCACAAAPAGVLASEDAAARQEDIVILFTSDVHCAAEENIGYSGLAAYQRLVQEQTPYVTLVDCGDAVQGGYMGVISDGLYVVEMMNELGYDLAVPGNHEFDYGTEALSAILEASEAQYLACNVQYSGEGSDALASARPYEILDYGGTRVAYIGVATPETLSKSTPAYFMEEGDYVYSFTAGEDGALLYDRVQSCVDECREAGADYVVLLTHLGDAEESAPYSSVDLIAATTGVDLVLDGHAHSVIPCRVVENRDGGAVLLSAVGTGMDNIGQAVISADGFVSVGLVSDYSGRDEEFDAFYEELTADFQEDMERVVAVSDMALSVSDEAGVRLVRCRETAIGNFCADAYRIVTGADIGVVNGGGIRADLPEGEIRYADVLAMHPYGNSLCVVRVSGQEILDCLEVASADTAALASENGAAVGENGSFLQVSGLRYSIDTTIPSPVLLDDAGMLVSMDGERRVRDVMVLGPDGAYEPLDPEGEYTLASHNYLLKQGGGGVSFFADNEFLVDEGPADYQVILEYLTEYRQGSLSGLYSGPEGRITVIG